LFNNYEYNEKKIEEEKMKDAHEYIHRSVLIIEIVKIEINCSNEESYWCLFFWYSSLLDGMFIHT